MQRFLYLLSILVILLSCLKCGSTPDLEIRLFANQNIHKIRILAATHPVALQDTVLSNTFSIRMSGGKLSCKGRFLEKAELRGQNGQILIAIGKKKRLLSGTLLLNIRNKELYILNRLPGEEYVAGVLAAETAPLPAERGAALALLKAEAVAIRSYAWYYRSSSGHARHQNYDFCDLTHCQVFRGMAPVSEDMRRAVRETKGKILEYEGRLVPGFYSSTCGGRSCSPRQAWGGGQFSGAFPAVKDVLHRQDRALPATRDILCLYSPHFVWEYRMPYRDWDSFLRRHYGVGADNVQWNFSRTDGIPDWPRVRALQISVPGREDRLIPAGEFRERFCRSFGWQTIKSLAFRFRIAGKECVWLGRGLGHGIGLCQYGALRMAELGYSWREILKHYYPNLAIALY